MICFVQTNAPHTMAAIDYAHSVMSDMTKKYMETIQKMEVDYKNAIQKAKWEREWLEAELKVQQELVKRLQEETSEEIAKVQEAMNQVKALDAANQRQAKLLESYQDELHAREEEILELKAKVHAPETIAPSTSPIGFLADPPSPISHNATCWGCRENQPNQLAHMDMGGCLYSDDEVFEV